MTVIPRSLVRIQLARVDSILVEWPSGLRRQVKALISSEARVRIPSQPLCHTSDTKNKYFCAVLAMCILWDSNPRIRRYSALDHSAKNAHRLTFVASVV